MYVKSVPDPKFPEKSHPDPKKIISDPQHCMIYMAGMLAVS